ncbi:hypothetical protein OsJ_31535 [Oryza sativa Japonica Group]|uniref:Uncharacterized protein n=1 Tax=Oryza sativa subsp. japonica TaxID=39947 RepID=B9G5R8_ORYSJ|nr:hypothetical protein OsJ_31535 [Oryza sativa Japonica Group]
MREKYQFWRSSLLTPNRNRRSGLSSRPHPEFTTAASKADGGGDTGRIRRSFDKIGYRRKKGGREVAPTGSGLGRLLEKKPLGNPAVSAAATPPGDRRTAPLSATLSPAPPVLLRPATARNPAVPSPDDRTSPLLVLLIGRIEEMMRGRIEERKINLKVGTEDDAAQSQ